MAFHGRTFQIGGHYRGRGFRVTVSLEYGKTPYVHRIDIVGLAAISRPAFDDAATTVNDALDMGFHRARDTISLA
jgi:hypothetical protein